MHAVLHATINKCKHAIEKTYKYLEWKMELSITDFTLNTGQGWPGSLGAGLWFHRQSARECHHEGSSHSWSRKQAMQTLVMVFSMLPFLLTTPYQHFPQWVPKTWGILCWWDEGTAWRFYKKSWERRDWQRESSTATGARARRLTSEAPFPQLYLPCLPPQDPPGACTVTEVNVALQRPAGGLSRMEETKAEPRLCHVSWALSFPF